MTFPPYPMTARCIIAPLAAPDELRDRVTAADWAAAADFSPRRRAEFLTWRAVVYRELGGVGIAYDPAGAPVLVGDPRHIGVSHAGDRVAVAISDRRCAVDIEPAGRDFSRAAARFLTPDEAALGDDPLLAGIVWCAKETLFKYAGRPSLRLLRDLSVEAVDFASGRIAGRICGGGPFPLRFELREGLIVVHIL